MTNAEIAAAIRSLATKWENGTATPDQFVELASICYENIDAICLALEGRTAEPENPLSERVGS